MNTHWQLDVALMFEILPCHATCCVVCFQGPVQCCSDAGLALCTLYLQAHLHCCLLFVFRHQGKNKRRWLCGSIHRNYKHAINVVTSACKQYHFCGLRTHFKSSLECRVCSRILPACIQLSNKVHGEVQWSKNVWRKFSITKPVSRGSWCHLVLLRISCGWQTLDACTACVCSVHSQKHLDVIWV